MDAPERKPCFRRLSAAELQRAIAPKLSHLPGSRKPTKGPNGVGEFYHWAPAGSYIYAGVKFQATWVKDQSGALWRADRFADMTGTGFTKMHFVENVCCAAAV